MIAEMEKIECRRINAGHAFWFRELWLSTWLNHIYSI